MDAETGGLAIFGGSFNPPHIGHLRLALEICETFHDRIREIQFLPCAHPPHKEERGLLPFDLRCRMLREVTREFPMISVNTIEGERERPSYTWETLQQLRLQDRPLYFVLGSDDYAELSEWYNGLDLPGLCTLLVVPRGDCTQQAFLQMTENFWGRSEICEQTECYAVVEFHGQHSIFFHAPFLPVSATDIRTRWMADRSVDFLVPSAVLALLKTHTTDVQQAWGK